MNKKITYLDNASTTKVDERVMSEMLPYFTEVFGNASSNHVFGKKAKEAIENARKYISDLINAKTKEITFTSGATESINMAIKGFTEANQHCVNHVITVKTEHKAVLATCEYLETKGIEVTYLNVDENGLISLKELKNSIKDNTTLLVVMYVNNETGVIQPINEIGKIATENGITFFCDATQAVGKVKVDVVKDNIDMLCFSGHKLNGPKGIGVLYKRMGIELTPLIHGGGQENGLRGGTYNTPLIVGIGKVCELLNKEFEENVEKLAVRRKEIERHYESSNIGSINFKNVRTAPHIISISLTNHKAEDYLLINRNQFSASTGSACNAEIVGISHVLRAMGIKKNNIPIRISLSTLNN